ncbi:CCA tRNA nucleotidyltransferase [Paenibacillus daejeonensis]|uniref:CCA tRNA nucleotidyltransferase n=1 Tax=Paenibacillus daejeonensis TaxID=135193 RepID=UPI0003779CEE|nr:CCA tRNA nucleotidyltransferase [Paenibacillus daejeonensis]
MITHEPMKSALPVLDRLCESYEAVFVGGCVRDALLGDEVTDVDIATSALPEQVMKLFTRTLPTGLQHGTVTVITEQGHFEVTTYRKESAYEGFRRPSKVEYIPSLTEDLRRRDFTINAMAMDREGRMIDPFGGQQDLEQRVIRCVGDPDARLQEDALRMLRGIRFAARLHARMETGTWEAVLHHRALLRHIAMERVGVELDKMIGGPDPDRACALLSESELLHHTREPLALSAKLDHSKIEGLSRLPDRDARWVALSILAGMSSKEAGAMLRSLRYATRRADGISAAVAFHQRMIASVEEETTETTDRERWTRVIVEHGREPAARWLEVLASGMLPLPSFTVKGPPQQLQQWLDELSPATLQELAVSGHEIQKLLDRRPGPWMKPLLQQLLLEAALGRVDNTREALEQRAISLNAKEQA